MSEAYEQFAKKTYATAYNNMEEALPKTGDLPMFVFSGERHSDDFIGIEILNNVIPDEQEEPVLAAAYTHMANIQAASDHVGKDNVVVSFELNTKTLKGFTDRIKLLKDGEDTLHNNEIVPMLETIKFAVNNGYEIVASDPLRDSSLQERFDAEKDIITNQAGRVHNPFKVLVHIGGARHIGNFQGYTSKELDENGKGLSGNKEIDPFDGIYGSKLFYNTAQPLPELFLSKIDSYEHPLDNMEPAPALFLDKNMYHENPANAIQIDPPGRMDEDDNDKHNIADRIQSASEEMHDPYIAPQPPAILTDEYKNAPAIKL